MITATELSKSRDAEREEHILNLRIENFIKLYQPQDPERAARFHVQLHELVRTIYSQATQPWEKTMISMLNAMPMPMHVFNPKGKL